MALTRFYPAAIGSKASLRHMELGRQIGDDIMRSRTHLHGTEAQNAWSKAEGQRRDEWNLTGTDRPIPYRALSHFVAMARLSCYGQ